jgi:phosphotransferase system IIA component
MIEKESKHMKGIVGMVLALSLASAAYASEDVVTAVHGSVEKIDSTSETIVVKTDDGVRHVVHFADRTAVHGAAQGKTQPRIRGMA